MCRLSFFCGRENTKWLHDQSMLLHHKVREVNTYPARLAHFSYVGIVSQSKDQVPSEFFDDIAIEWVRQQTAIHHDQTTDHVIYEIDLPLVGKFCRIRLVLNQQADIKLLRKKQVTWDNQWAARETIAYLCLIDGVTLGAYLNQYRYHNQVELFLEDYFKHYRGDRQKPSVSVTNHVGNINWQLGSGR